MKNIEFVGMVIIEIGMVWFWLDKCILKWLKVEGIEYLKNVFKNIGIFFVGVYFLIFELGVRIVGLYY